MRILDVIPNPLPEVFSFLKNAKVAVHNPSRQLIVRALGTDSVLSDLVQSHIVQTIKQGRDYNGLLAFWSSISIWSMTFMKEAGKNEQDIISMFLGPVSEILPLKKNSDAQIAAYMVLAVLSNQFDLNQEIVSNALVSIASGWSKASLKSGFACITQLLRSDGEYEPLNKEAWSVLEKVKNADQLIIELSESYKIGSFTTFWAISLIANSPEKLASVVNVLRTKPNLTEAQIFSISKSVCELAKAVSRDQKDTVVALIELLLSSKDNAEAFNQALKALKLSFQSLELHLESTIKRVDDIIDEEQSDVSMEDIDEHSVVDSHIPIQELTQSSHPSFLSIDASENFDRAVGAYALLPRKRATVESLARTLKIKEEAVPTFLARTWVGPYAQVTRIRALSDFVAIIEKSKQQDFQAFVPLMLVGLMDPSEKVRRITSAGFGALRAKYPLKKPTVVGLDNIYGPGQLSGNVKWLAVKDLTQFLDKVVSPSLDECILSSQNALQLLPQAIAKIGSKSFTSTISSFIVSHALSVEIPRIKTALLCFVDKLDRLDPKSFESFFASWVSSRDSWKQRCINDKFDFAALESAVVSSVRDKASTWFLEKCIKSNHSELADFASAQLVKIWPTIGEGSQLEMFRFLLNVAVDDFYSFDAQVTLAKIDISSSLLLAVLEECRLQADRGSDVAKRRRRSSNTAKRQLQGELMSAAERHLHKVTLIFEIIDNSKPKASVKLLESLFSLLDEILSLGTDSNVPVFYTLQLLANCMIYVVEQLKNGEDRVSKLNSNNMRVNSIVQTIRSSSSPQVQNRFLLLVSSLASLEPELVLHSVMPIFTFMGANTLRQDDEYSAHVIEETIGKVIPQMLKQEKHVVDADIDVVLKSFVVAFDHIPRHRRVRLFSSLVRAVGTQLCLHKLLVLLGQKYSDAKIKRKNVDIRQLVLFGESFLASFSVYDQVGAINQYVKIVEEIPLVSQDDEVPAVLPFSLGNSQIFTSDDFIRLKANLFDYLAQLIGNEEAVSNTQLLRIRMSVLSREAKSDVTKDKEYDAVLTTCSVILGRLLADRQQIGIPALILDSAFGVISQCLNILAISDFVQISRKLLESGHDVDVKAKALRLVQSKFETEPSNDVESTKAAFDAIEIFVSYLQDSVNIDIEINALLLDDLDILLAKFGTNGPQDLLLRVLDVVVGPVGLQSDEAKVMVPATACINSLCMILGARMIGYFGKIVPVCFKHFEESLKSSGEQSAMIQLSVFGLIAGMIKRIPAFMTSSLKRTFEFVFLSSVSADLRRSLLTTCIEVMEPRDVITAYISTWKYAVESNFDSVGLFLETLDMTIDATQKKVVSGQADSIVSLLLEAFTSVAYDTKYDSNTLNRITNLINSTGVKIVMKLNDKTFRPLFIRMVRWAVESEIAYNSKATAKLVVFFKFVVKLLQSLKSIITNYYGYLLDPVCDILDRYASGQLGSTADEASVRRSILTSLNVSFQNDNEEFWQSQARFDKVCSALISQIPTAGKDAGMLLVKTIVSLAELCPSQDHHKAINDGLIKYMHAGNSSNEKIWSIKILHGLYSNLGEEWVSLLPQLVPLIAELLEDDDEAVELEVRRKLVPVVEDVLGESLDRYLS
jgi:U3 small nucleolar RNA-associated protein 10